MNALDLLTFARGSALNWALMLCVAGIVLRLFEIFGLAVKPIWPNPAPTLPAVAGAPSSRARCRHKAC